MNTQPEQPAQKTNRLAIISLILGIIGIFFIVYGWLSMRDPFCSLCIVGLFMYWLAGLLFGLSGLITGIFAIRLNKKGVNYHTGKAIAIIGMVLGLLNCLPGVYLILTTFV